MQSKTKGFHSLSRRIVALFCLFTLALSLIYGMITFVLMYTLEDSFIEKSISIEADYLSAAYGQSGEWPTPRKSNMTLHYSKLTLPEDIRQIALEEDLRAEFYGENGRHYHLYTVSGNPEIYLLAEVSADLLVRPIRTGVIQFLIISGLIVTIIACLIAWLVGRRMTKPLWKLSDLVDGLKPEQIPEHFAHQYPKNEIGILATTLENTLTRISQVLDREKCFTRDVSHELRSPLAVIQNGLELLSTNEQLESGQKQVLERIAKASEQMEKTVYTLLMLAREEHASEGKSRVALMPILEQSVLDNGRLLKEKPVDITINDNCNTEVYAQSGMLKVLIDNLLSNAFQFTEQGEVSIHFSGNAILVKDTGPGIDASISHQVTDPAIKGEQSTGFGFGLSIVKRLCEHQDWVLKVETNKAADTGTSIEVKLSN